MYLIYDSVLIRAFVAERLGVPMSADGTGIGMRANDGTLQVGVLYDNYNGASICMHVACRAGALWATPTFLRAAFRYPFEQLGLKKVLGLVAEGNAPCQSFCRSIGFVLEATLKDAHLDGNLSVFSMTRAECRWLNHREKVAAHGQVLTSAAA